MGIENSAGEWVSKFTNPKFCYHVWKSPSRTVSKSTSNFQKINVIIYLQLCSFSCFQLLRMRFFVLFLSPLNVRLLQTTFVLLKLKT